MVDAERLERRAASVRAETQLESVEENQKPAEHK